MTKDKKAIAEAIIEGVEKYKDKGYIPYLESDEEGLDFDEGATEKEEKENITKAFTTLFNG